MPRIRWNPEGRALWPLVWRDARWPVYVMAAHFALAILVDVTGLLPVTGSLLLNIPAFVTMLAVSALVLPVLLGVSRLRHHSWRAAQRHYLTLRSLVGVLVVAVFVAEESQIHEAFKRLLGRVNPFRWDAALSHASILLHGGAPAWRWLSPVFHAPRLTAALDTLYLGWFPIVFLLGCLLAWLPRRRLRQRALLTWGLVWVGLGTVLAQIFSSAGPVYYHHVVSGPDPYAPLMAHLDSVNTVLPLGAVRLHASVWANLHRVHDLRWLHISAFPSMHVAVPAVFACLWWRQWRPAGVLLWAVTVIILIGSIYLGWHYAVDGYVSVLGVLACWLLAGRLLARRPVASHDWGMDDFPDWTPEQARRAKRLAWAMGLTALVCWGMAAAAITAFVLFLTQ